MSTCNRLCSAIVLLFLLLAGCSSAPADELSSLVLLPGAHMALADPAPSGFKRADWAQITSVHQNGGAIWLFLPENEAQKPETTNDIKKYLPESEPIVFNVEKGVVYFFPAAGMDILPQVQAHNLESLLPPSSLARLWVIHGDALKSGGNLDEAIDAYTQAIALAPELVQAHLALGEALRERGKHKDLEAARKAFENAISLDPHNYQALRSVGEIYLFDLRKPFFAIEPLTKAYLLNPERTGILALVTVALAENGQKEQALQVLNDLQTRTKDEGLLHTINDIRQAYFSDAPSQ